MKTLFLASVAMACMLQNQNSEAANSPLNCKENGTAPDSGYSLYVSKNGQRALVEEVSVAGAKTLATLICKPSDLRAPCCDQEYVLLTCYEPNLKDGGFSVQVKQGGFTGATTAVLSEINIAGSHPVAFATCETLD